MSPPITTDQFDTLIRWAVQLERMPGRRLATDERQWAMNMGVMNVDAVKVIDVNKMPPPPEELRELAEAYLNPENAAGLTLGHTIYIKNGCYSQRLLQHELRHVYQVEQCGTIGFFQEYIRQLFEQGYSKADFELDAIAASESNSFYKS